MLGHFVILTVSVVLSAANPKDSRCFPPTHINLHPKCVEDQNSQNANYDCEGAHFERSAGIFIPCQSNFDCQNLGEPNEWCNSDQKGFQWTVQSCHCDFKLGACTVQRFDKRTNDIQWAYCTPRDRFVCDQSDYCSPTSL